MRSKSFIVMLLALLVVIGTVGSAFALGTTVSNEKLGDAIVFGYYDTRTVAQGGAGLTDNYFTVTNTSNSYIQAHVRVRTGEKSIELLDFDAMLTPKDVFGFDLYEIDNNIWFASCDTHTLTQSGFTLNFDRDGDGTKDCVLMTSDSTSPFFFSNLTALIKKCDATLTDDQAIAQTLKGYVEVLGEGRFILDPFDEDCDTLPPGTTLYDWDHAGCSVDTLGNVLLGKVYYADTEGKFPVAIGKLAMLNGTHLQGWGGDDVILHKDSYGAELASPTGPGYAYDAPSATPNGAQDENFCLFDPTPATINKIGAAATYGPTLADSHYSITPEVSRIDVGFPVPWDATLFIVDSLASDPLDAAYDNSTSVVYSHFFNLAPPFVSTFVFTFPTMHFIDQKISVAETSAFDTEENDCIIPPDKFISPGLPGEPTLVPEVAITHPTTCPSFAEGWRTFSLVVKSDGPGSATGLYDVFDGDDDAARSVPATGYSPLAIPATYILGDDVFATSPMVKDSGTSFVSWTEDE